MESNDKTINISITTATMFKALAVLLLLYFLYLIRDILMILFVSLIFSSAVDPWVDWFQRKKIPRSLSILFIYLVAFSFLAFAIYSIIPPIAEQIGDLAKNLPSYLDKATSSITALREYSLRYGLFDEVGSSLDIIGSNLQNAAGGVFSTVSGIFGGIFSFVLVLVLTFYMVVEENAIKKLVWSVAPKEQQTYVMQLLNRMQKKIGLWLRGQLLLSFFIFLMVYIGLLILKVKYALVLALIAGLTEFVPYLGPILGAIPAVFLAFTQSPVLALFVAIFYYVVQLTENNILVPKVMQKAVGLNPLISITVLMVGFSVAGVAGAILSIPVATAVSIFIGDIFDGKRGDTPEPEF